MFSFEWKKPFPRSTDFIACFSAMIRKKERYTRNGRVDIIFALRKEILKKKETGSNWVTCLNYYTTLKKCGNLKQRYLKILRFLAHVKIMCKKTPIHSKNGFCKFGVEYISLSFCHNFEVKKLFFNILGSGKYLFWNIVSFEVEKLFCLAFWSKKNFFWAK